MATVRKFSRKRELILDNMRSSHEHPSAETIYEDLKPVLPELSLGTVYRNLSVFQEDGIIRRVCSVNGQDRFDYNVSEHPHLVCTKCGRVLDIDMSSVDVDLSQVSALNGVEVDRMDIVFYGLCPVCK